MKKFTIIYAHQSFFGQGFRTSTTEVWGAVNALRVLKSIRGMKNPAVWVSISC